MFTVKNLELLKSLPLRQNIENDEYEMAIVEDEQKVYQVYRIWEESLLKASSSQRI